MNAQPPSGTQPPRPEPPWIATIPRMTASVLLFAIAYFLAARLGAWLSITNASFITFWPPSGLYLAVLLSLPSRRWWPFLLAALAASAVNDIALEGNGLPLTLGYYGIDTLTSVLAATLIRSWCGSSFNMNNLRNAFVLAATSTGFILGLSAPLAAVLVHDLVGSPYERTWMQWALSCWSGTWLTAPLILALISGKPDGAKGRLVEGALLYASLIVVSYGVYFDRLDWISSASFPLIWLIWAAIRFGVKGISVGIFILAVLATRAAASGIGPFVHANLPHQDAELRVLLYLGVLSVVFHIVAAILQERTQAQHDLQVLNDQLEAQAQARADQLLDVEHKYETLVSQAFGGIAEVDETGRYITVNNRYCDILGYGREELLGMRLHDVTHPDDLDQSLHVLRNSPVTHQPTDFEKRYVRKDGTTIWGHVFVAPIYSRNGHLRSVSATVIDITERKTAEEERKKLANLIEHSNDFIGFADLDGQIEYLNAAGRRMIGLAPDTDIRQVHFADYVAPDWLDTFRNSIVPTLKTTGAWNGEMALINLATGLRVEVSRSTFALHDEVGTPIGLGTVTRDITARKNAEIAMRENRAKLALFIEHAPVALAMFDHDMRYLAASRRWLSDYGLGDRDIVGLSHYEVFPDVPDHWRDIHNRAMAGEIVRSEEDVFQRADGSQQWLRWEVRPWPRVSGDIGGILIFTEDISQRRQAEAQLRKLSLAVEQSPASIIITGLDGRIEYVNEAFVRITGYEKAEAIGRDPHFLASGKTPPASFQALWTHLGQGVPWQGELFNKRKDGTEYIDAAIIVPLRQPDGRITHYVAVQDDVTEQKRQAYELARHRHHLEELVEERTAALKSTLEKLTQSEENIRLVMDSTLMPIFVADESDRYTYANPAALSTLGYREDELMCLRLQDLVADCDRQRLDELIEATRQGATRLATWHLKHKDGRDIPFELMTQQLADRRFLAIGYDKSERLATEQQLHLAARVFESTFEGILIANADNIIVDVNQAFVNLTGFSREDAIGQNPRILNSGRHDKAFFEAMRQAYMEQGHWQGEIWNRCKDGRIVTHYMTISTVREDGVITHFIGLFTDITERKLSELLLQESEERLRLATESANIGLWSWNIRSNTAVCTDKFKSLLGLPADWICNYENFLAVIHPEDRDRVARDVSATIREKTILHTEYRVLRPDGVLSWLVSIGSSYSDDAGEVERLTGIVMDITERKMADKRLHEQQNALEANDKQKDEFIAMLSHEIRNPLAAINNAIAVLHRSGSADQTVKWVETTIGGQLKQLNRLVGDLLDVSRITHGKFELKSTRIAVADLIQRAVEMSRPVIGKLGHRLHVTPPVEALYLEGDMTRLVQVIDNLLHNAAKYTQTGGEIWLNAERDAKELVIRVRDNGVGISPDMLSSVFTLFTQGPLNPHKVSTGMGIGLSLVERLVQLHNGSITVSSPGVGHGSEFCVRLPLAEQRSSRSRQPVEETSAIEAETPTALRVLVIDDEPAVADSFAMLLGLMGHNVEVAYNGNEAFGKIEPFRPQVVFLDIGIPDMNGFEIMRGFQSMALMTDIPVIALTGFGQERDIQRTAEAGFAAHMTKPVDPDRLETLLDSLIPG